MAHVLTRDRLQRFFNAINISLFPSPIRRCHLRIASVPATNAKSFRFDINFQIKKMKSASNLFRELNKHLFFTWSPRIRIWVIGLKIKLFDAMTNIWRLAANIFKPSFCVDCQFSCVRLFTYTFPSTNRKLTYFSFSSSSFSFRIESE